MTNYIHRDLKRYFFIIFETLLEKFFTPCLEVTMLKELRLKRKEVRQKLKSVNTATERALRQLDLPDDDKVLDIVEKARSQLNNLYTLMLVRIDLLSPLTTSSPLNLLVIRTL